MRLSRFVILLVTVGLILTAGVAQAGPTGSGLPNGWWDQDYHWCPDPVGDAVGGFGYEIYGIGWTVIGDWAYVCVETDFPESGLTGPAEQGGPPVDFFAGDLYINVGGMFQQGTGNVYGIGAVNNGPSVAGTAYAGATFDTGLFEDYPTGTPSDGNDGDGINDYPTIINGWSDSSDPLGAYHYEAGATPHGGSQAYYFAFQHGAFTDSEGRSLESGASLQITWAMTCGNDLAEYKVEPEIPEPATVALVSAGIAALAAKRRRGIL